MIEVIKSKQKVIQSNDIKNGFKNKRIIVKHNYILLYVLYELRFKLTNRFTWCSIALNFSRKRSFATVTITAIPCFYLNSTATRCATISDCVPRAPCTRIIQG